MSYVPGANLTFDDDGLLYEPDLREFASAALAPDQVIAIEAVLAVSRAAWILDEFMRGLGDWYGMRDDRMRVLRRLHEHRTGLPLDELLLDLDLDDVDGAGQLLDEVEGAGLITRSPASGRDASAWIRLSDQGLHLMDEVLRRIADQLSAVSQGVGVEQLVLVRHVCLWMASNRELLQPGQAPG
jgi:hypothetical protein